MKSNLRLAAATAACVGAAWANAAFAEWPFGSVARLQPGFGGVCEECDLSGRLLVGVHMTHGVFHHSNFARAVMAHAVGAGGKFDDSDFSDAILDDADFSFATFGRARMTNARVLRTVFVGADLSKTVGLTQAQLAEACGDAATKLPRRLTIPRCEPQSTQAASR